MKRQKKAAGGKRCSADHGRRSRSKQPDRQQSAWDVAAEDIRQRRKADAEAPVSQALGAICGLDGDLPNEQTHEPPLPSPPSPGRCRQFVRRQLAEALPAICRKLTNDAQAGGLPSLKQLWQMAGLEGEQAAARATAKSMQPERFARRVLPAFRPD